MNKTKLLNYLIQIIGFILGQFISQINALTHLRRMDSPTIISSMSPFSILGVLGGIFFQILIETDQIPRYKVY